MSNFMSSKVNYLKNISQTTAVNGNGIHTPEKSAHFECVTSNAKKSHVEKSIERLYGPGALGIGFQTRRSLIEKQRQSPAREDKTEELGPTSLPRVFKHLRPAFRSQLFENDSISSNSDPKSDSQSSSKENIFQSVKCKQIEGPVVRHIPIHIDENHPSLKKSENNGIEDSINNSLKKLEVNGKTPASHHPIEKPITKVVNNLGHNYNLRSRSMTPKNVNISTNSNILIPKTLNFTQTGKENVETTQKLAKVSTAKTEEKDTDRGGNHFLKFVEVEVNFLNKYADLIEKDNIEFGKLMDEELKGKLLATVGKIRLLVNQKIKQFQGLCFKNINGSSAEDFPTTDDDLAGFWDMVSLQIDSVKGLITEWERVKANGWKEITPVPAKQSNGSRPVQKTKTTLTTEQKAQIEARKKIQDERRKAMREAIMAKRKQTKENEQVEKFASKTQDV